MAARNLGLPQRRLRLILKMDSDIYNVKIGNKNILLWESYLRILLMRQNYACDLQITVVKPTSVLVVGFYILEAIDNGGLTCQRQDRSAGLNSSHVNVQLTLSDRKNVNKEIQRFAFQSGLSQKKSKPEMMFCQ